MNFEINSKEVIKTTWSSLKKGDGLTVSEFWRLRSAIMNPQIPTKISFDERCNSAYTKLENTFRVTDANIGLEEVAEKMNLRVVIGGEMVNSVAQIPATISTVDGIKVAVQDTDKAISALMYHELGHVLFTDMRDTSILDYKDKKYVGFLAQLFNIIEDPIIEGLMCEYCRRKFPKDKNPREYFDFIIKRIFCNKAVKFQPQNDAASFMNYMLLRLRLGAANVPEHPIFTKYEGDIIPQIVEIFRTRNATERLKKIVKFGEWMIANIKELDFSNQRKDEHPTTGSMSGAPGSIGGGNGGSSRGGNSQGGEDGQEEQGGSQSKEWDGGNESRGQDKEGETDKDSVLNGMAQNIQNGIGATPMQKAEGGGISGNGSTLGTGMDVQGRYDDVAEILASPTFKNTPHSFYDAENEFIVQNPELFEEIENMIKDNKDLEKEISKYLNLIHQRKKPKLASGFTSGRLNMKEAMQNELKDGCNLKIFNRVGDQKPGANLCVSVLCDNSGSMSGQKSEIAARAVLALAQACEWSDIPFEVNSFTSSYSEAITVRQKRFDQKLKEAKPFLGINSYHCCEKLSSSVNVGTFNGNKEEINIHYIAKELQGRREKTKLLIVLCDGETCGSKAALKQEVTQAESQGIVVIGIGIMDTAVQQSYQNNKVFKSIEDLKNGLAPYLIEILSKYGC